MSPAPGGRHRRRPGRRRAPPRAGRAGAPGCHRVAEPCSSPSLYIVQCTKYRVSEELMTTERSGAGDPVRTLALLWRRTEAVPRRGPRPTLSIDAVVEAATGLADAAGLDAVTMRRVAAALNASPMTLYTYIPSKAERLDRMLDAAYARMPRADTAGQPWRRRLRAIADENMALFATHPW